MRCFAEAEACIDEINCERIVRTSQCRAPPESHARAFD
jgi:hypothetical protein